MSGKVTWLAKEPAPTGHQLFLTLRLPGYRLDTDGSLLEIMDQNPDQEAWVVLSGQVRGCRLFQEELYLLRLTNLVRLLE
jgi:hypothetical protein